MPLASTPDHLTCSACDGTGSVHRRTCSACSGRGDVSCHLCPHHEPATRMGGDEPCCEEHARLVEADTAEYLRAQPLDALTNDERTWLADYEQARSERIACGGEAWSGGFAENH